MASDEPNELEDLLARYIELLNDGEHVDLERILAEETVHGPEIVEHLKHFVDSTIEGEVPLGTLGDYTLREQIGRGGMGIVYEAWQHSMDRPVALKVMPKAVAADTRAVARFMQEAQLAGKLSHPNIVNVHGIGVEQQIPYYAMDLVEGGEKRAVAQLRATGRTGHPRSGSVLRAARRLARSARPKGRWHRLFRG